LYFITVPDLLSQMKKGNFSLISLGCARTLVDSEKAIDSLQQIGFTLVPEGTQEKITILNTCSFIQAAIDETETNILTLQEKKRSGEIKHLVVIGCYPSRFKKKELELKYPLVDIFLTTQEQHLLHQQLYSLVFSKKFAPTKTQKPYLKLTPSHYSYLKISEGCDNWCAFCTIPKIRGTHISKTIEDIKEEAIKQLSYGAKELILIAEDTTAWGEDIYGKPSLHLLLEELATLPVEWIRLMYIYPSRVNEDLIQVIKKHKNICRYIDMPIQHASNSQLDSMKRNHSKEHLEWIFNRFKEEIPDLVFRTTLIAGFPGETEENHQELLTFLHDFPFHQLGCFAYSVERETRAFRFENKCDEKTIKFRVESVMETQYNIIKKINKEFINKTVSILYEGNNLGRAYFQAPEVDGSLVIDTKKTLVPGQFYSGKIIAVNGYDMTATI
jgi:ribosomal protein S12 methylthiotransferase